MLKMYLDDMYLYCFYINWKKKTRKKDKQKVKKIKFKIVNFTV